MVEQKKCSKKAVLNRLARLEGQIRGIRRMIEEEQECEKIMAQLRAVNAALEGATKLILFNYLGDCLSEHDHGGEEILARIAGVLFRGKWS